MVVRVESEYYGGKEVAVTIKMFPQELEIFKLGLAATTTLAYDHRPSSNIVNTRIWKTFQKIVHEIIEQSTPGVINEDNNEDEDDRKEEQDQRRQEDLYQRKDDRIKLEIDEFHGVVSFGAPYEKDPEEFIKQEKKRLNLKNDTEIEDLLYEWLRDPLMRNRIMFEDGL